MESHNVVHVLEVDGECPPNPLNFVVSSHWSDKTKAVITVDQFSYTLDIGELAAALKNAQCL